MGFENEEVVKYVFLMVRMQAVFTHAIQNLGASSLISGKARRGHGAETEERAGTQIVQQIRNVTFALEPDLSKRPAREVSKTMMRNLNMVYLVNLTLVYAIDGTGKIWKEHEKVFEQLYQHARRLLVGIREDMQYYMERRVAGPNQETVQAVINFVLSTLTDRNFTYGEQERKAISAEAKRVTGEDDFSDALVERIDLFMEHAREMPFPYAMSAIPADKNLHIQLAGELREEQIDGADGLPKPRHPAMKSDEHEDPVAPEQLQTRWSVLSVHDGRALRLDAVALRSDLNGVRRMVQRAIYAAEQIAEPAQADRVELWRSWLFRGFHGRVVFSTFLMDRAKGRKFTEQEKKIVTDLLGSKEPLPAKPKLFLNRPEILRRTLLRSMQIHFGRALVDKVRCYEIKINASDRSHAMFNALFEMLRGMNIVGVVDAFPNRGPGHYEVLVRADRGRPLIRKEFEDGLMHEIGDRFDLSL